MSPKEVSAEWTMNILLVEDDEVDAEALLRAFRKRHVTVPLTVVKNGLEALMLLRSQREEKHLPRPYIILLDINMPQMNGLEFLEALRQDETLKTSIVFVLTTSIVMKIRQRLTISRLPVTYLNRGPVKNFKT
ncbi:MAG: response regulator [Caldilineaceae bacterium]